MVTGDWSLDWKVMEYPDHNINGKAVRRGKIQFDKNKSFAIMKT